MRHGCLGVGWTHLTSGVAAMDYLE